MTLPATITPGDIVKCDVKGRVFHATVQRKTAEGLRVTPIERGINHFEVTSRQVSAYYRKLRPRR